MGTVESRELMIWLMGPNSLLHRRWFWPSQPRKLVKKSFCLKCAKILTTGTSIFESNALAVVTFDPVCSKTQPAEKHCIQYDWLEHEQVNARATWKHLVYAPEPTSISSSHQATSASSWLAVRTNCLPAEEPEELPHQGRHPCQQWKIAVSSTSFIDQKSIPWKLAHCPALLVEPWGSSPVDNQIHDVRASYAQNQGSANQESRDSDNDFEGYDEPPGNAKESRTPNVSATERFCEKCGWENGSVCQRHPLIC